MRVLAMVPALHDTSPGQRYRIEQWQPLLRERDVEIVHEPFESEELHSLLYKSGNLPRKLALVSHAIGRRLRSMKSVREFDLVSLFREAALLGPTWLDRGFLFPG